MKDRQERIWIAIGLVVIAGIILVGHVKDTEEKLEYATDLNYSVAGKLHKSETIVRDLRALCKR